MQKRRVQNSNLKAPFRASDRFSRYKRAFERAPSRKMSERFPIILNLPIKFSMEKTARVAGSDARRRTEPMACRWFEAGPSHRQKTTTNSLGLLIVRESRRNQKISLAIFNSPGLAWEQISELVYQLSRSLFTLAYSFYIPTHPLINLIIIILDDNDDDNAVNDVDDIDDVYDDDNNDHNVDDDHI